MSTEHVTIAQLRFSLQLPMMYHCTGPNLERQPTVSAVGATGGVTVSAVDAAEDVTVSADGAAGGVTVSPHWRRWGCHGYRH